MTRTQAIRQIRKGQSLTKSYKGYEEYPYGSGKIHTYQIIVSANFTIMSDNLMRRNYNLPHSAKTILQFIRKNYSR